MAELEEKYGDDVDFLFTKLKLAQDSKEVIDACQEKLSIFMSSPLLMEPHKLGPWGVQHCDATLSKVKAQWL